MSRPAPVDTYPLTPMQQGMLFHHLQASNPGVDIEQMVGVLHEQVDVVALEAAWQVVADRHPILRTQYAWSGLDQPVQNVLDRVDVSLTAHDVRERPAHEQQRHLETFLFEDRMRGFDLSAGPLWRLAIFQFGESDQRFIFTYHHSLLDVSVVWVVEEAFGIYDGDPDRDGLGLIERRPFREHVEWLTAHVAERQSAADAYFRELLAGFDEPTALTALAPIAGAPEPGPGYVNVRFRLSESVSERLHATSRDLGIGLAAFVETAWGLVLAAFSGSSDVVFGSTRGSRRTGMPGSESIIGLFINTPPVRLVVDPDQSLADLLTAVRAQQIAKRDFEHTPLTQIHAAMDLRGASLFDTIVVVNDLHQGTRLRRASPAFASREFDLHDQTNFNVTLLGYMDPQIHFKVSYDPRTVDAAGIERVRDLFVQLFESIPDHLSTPIRELPRLPARDHDVLAQWNATGRDYPSAATIPELFETQVDQTPDAVAVVFRSQRLTYRQLDERSNAVAARLRDLGVGPDSMVGVLIERSIDMVVGLMGILKAGGAYVPMDPTYPAIRLSMMLEDSHANVVLTHAAFRSLVPPTIPNVIELDQVDLAPAPRTPAAGLTSDNLAYVIFTSGSTGRPKGVMIEHRNVVNFFTAMDDELDHDPSQRPGTWLAVTSISFDISVLELFWSLTRGFTLVVQEDEDRRAETPSTAVTPAALKPVDFSLFYFAADAGSEAGNRYRLLLDGARFADSHGFTAVWTPERHFHEFGGNYPNPALTSAAVAMVTERVAIRAGSVVLPLHNPIGLAEDWSVVDNLSNGRVGLSFASGWHANDFALAPDHFADRRQLMAEGLETIRALWRGDSVSARSGDGRDIEVRLFPPPIQTAPGIWITAGGSPDTFAMAGRIGANILTNLLVMSRDDLVKNIGIYRDAFAASGHAGVGHVSLMLHTFVGDDLDTVRALVREPFLQYLRTSTDLINQVQWERTSFAKPGERSSAADAERSLSELTDDEMQVLMDHAFDRYFKSAGLFGTPETCLATVRELSDLGVDEIACLIDFGVDEDRVLEALEPLAALRELAASAVGDEPTLAATGVGVEPASGEDQAHHDQEQHDLISQFGRHGITHMQCTPSLASIIAAQPGGIVALSGLRKLLVGGEALPPMLVEQIYPALSGDLLNMYGPTETTIWSTVSKIRSATAPITIGRPIANTQIFIVDKNLLPTPIGVPGELLIGGEGVVRGYLDRAELTAERFIHLPAAAGRVYRTGDRARLLADGNIEFGGRLDHQVKIRGYRIELGEIEAAIGRFPSTSESVVVARSDSAGDPRLVAYVVSKPTEGNDIAQRWGDLWNETYRSSDATDATFDIAGWNDSYTGAPIPAIEMRDWVDETVARILALQPRRTLEVGCGTGLFLFRIAPSTDSYVGLDLARAAVERVDAGLRHSPIDGARVIQAGAHQLAELFGDSADRFDTIIVNSVAQYFPDLEYLIDVIANAMRLLEPGGALFLGDLRSLAHLEMFAASTELAKAPDDELLTALSDKTQQRITREEELLVAPAMFGAIRSAVPDVGEVISEIKQGRFDNEMTRFRYDVVLRKRGAPSGPRATAPARRIDGLDVTIDAIRGALVDGPAVLRVEGIRNARLVADDQLVRQLRDPSGLVASARSPHPTASALHPHDVADLDARYATTLSWSARGPEFFDLVLRSRLVPSAEPTRFVETSDSLAMYSNQPARHAGQSIGTELRAHLRASLPDYMVPTAIVVLDALPRTPNGKIDRNALPAPDRSRTEADVAVVAPENEIEHTIAGIWRDMLALDTVGVETNLFDLGANSLMMVQASSRIGVALERPISLVEMFRFPTVRSLAGHLEGGGLDGGSDVEQVAMQRSQDRGQNRKDALLRRRSVRSEGRGERQS